MYAETETSLIFSPDVQQFYDFSYSHKSNASLDSLVQSCNISDYDLGAEGDLFKAPAPIIEQPLDPITEQLSDDFLTNVYNEILETETSPLSEVLNYNFAVKTDESSIVKEHVHPPGHIPKSMSSDCLNSMDRAHQPPIKPGFLQVDFENVYGMRRAFSDGDIKTLANGNGNNRCWSLGQPPMTSDHVVEDRWQKLSRYRIKKSKRNFGRKIKYACRKALADSQPRIRGRFAKTEECDIWRK